MDSGYDDYILSKVHLPQVRYDTSRNCRPVASRSLKIKRWPPSKVAKKNDARSLYNVVSKSAKIEFVTPHPFHEFPFASAHLVHRLGNCLLMPVRHGQ